MIECFSHALVDKRQVGVVVHLRLCASALLRHGRMFSCPFLSFGQFCWFSLVSFQSSSAQCCSVGHACTRGSSPIKRVTHFHGCGALRLNAAITTEQAHQRLEIAEGVTQEVQDKLQPVTAGHQAAHEALQAAHQEITFSAVK